MSDELLYAISTLGKLSIEKYREILDTLNSFGEASGNGRNGDPTYARYRLLRLLDALGHCEYDPVRRNLYACPPTFLSLPTCGLPKAVLTGARSPKLLQGLEGFVHNKRREVFLLLVEQSYGDMPLPQAVYIEAVHLQNIIDAAISLGIGSHLSTPAAWNLINFSLGIEGIKKSLSFEERHEPGWKTYIFSYVDLTFRQHSDDGGGGKKLVAYRNPVTQQIHHWLWEDRRAAQVDREWGRYLILADRHTKILIYDKQRQRLAVPTTVPLPRLLARAVTLCTGRVPLNFHLSEAVGGVRPGKQLDLYDGITPPLVEVLSAKLGQVPVNYSLAIKMKGV